MTCLKPVAGNELLIVTNGGGAGVLAVDDLVETGGSLVKLSNELIAKLDTMLPRPGRAPIPSTLSATQRRTVTPPRWTPFSMGRTPMLF